MEKDQFDILNAKLDLILVNLPKKKEKKEPAGKPVQPLKALYKRTVKEMFTASDQNSDFKQASEIREIMAAKLEREVPDNHATWIGRIMTQLEYPGGIRKVKGKTVRGFYVTINS